MYFAENLLRLDAFQKLGARFGFVQIVFLPYLRLVARLREHLARLVLFET
jgi:hypothetical protein